MSELRKSQSLCFLFPGRPAVSPKLAAIPDGTRLRGLPGSARYCQGRELEAAAQWNAAGVGRGDLRDAAIALLKQMRDDSFGPRAHQMLSLSHKAQCDPVAPAFVRDLGF